MRFDSCLAWDMIADGRELRLTAARRVERWDPLVAQDRTAEAHHGRRSRCSRT
jgi:hypothetical protein